ncbi:peptidoglycan DD-metalloendopeptidase family protein [Halochromatium salexigens]|uniref:peptidoglycan DD-metalloendopeptidase family protein n=1 Tax=Halochromatium salexigens TaxID=49447 RepID=UPI001911FC33
MARTLLAASLLLAAAAVGGMGGALAASGQASTQPPSTQQQPANQGLEAVAEHEAALEQLQARLRALRTSIDDNLRYRDALFKELRQFERDIDDLSRANRELEALVTEQQAALVATEARLQALRADLEHARAALADLVRTAYGLGHGDQIRMLLGQEDPRRAERLFGYYQIVAAARAARVEEIQELEQGLHRLEQRERKDTARLARLASRQDRTRQRLSSALGARAAILADLEQLIADEQIQATALSADADALSALIARLKRSAEIAAEAELTPASITDRRGRLAWPLRPARILRGFGEGRAHGALHADGVLLEADAGSEVHAVHHGRVVYADWLRGFGMLLVIDHGGGYMTLYGHNRTLMKEVGEWVESGDLIALAGSSGGAEHNALYFAIRHQGQAIDPGRWCRSTPVDATSG